MYENRSSINLPLTNDKEKESVRQALGQHRVIIETETAIYKIYLSSSEQQAQVLEQVNETKLRGSAEFVTVKIPSGENAVLTIVKSQIISVYS